MVDVPGGWEVRGIIRLVDFHQKNQPADTHDTFYVRGWTYVLVWSEALKRADKAGKLTGEGVKTALETLKDFDLGGLTAPVTYASSDHRPTTTVNIYQIKNGKLAKAKQHEMERKPEWLRL